MSRPRLLVSLIAACVGVCLVAPTPAGLARTPLPEAAEAEQAGTCRKTEVPACVTRVQTRSVKEVLADAAALQDKTVAVRGTLGKGSPICTLLQCPASNPCCNRCSAVLELREGYASLPLRDVDGRLSCSADNCHELCCPVSPDGVTVIAQGTLRYEALSGTVTICRP